MEKTRVKKGDEYWYVHFGLEGVSVFSAIDFGDEAANFRFECGNYSHTKEEAESMAEKLRAVLKGADVIEMPSEEEISEKVDSYRDFIAECAKKGEKVDSRFPFWFLHGVDWLKSKIVK